MGRVKELLLEKDYNEMIKSNNENIREYYLTIEDEFIPDIDSNKEYYLLKYKILDLRTLKTVTIKDKVLEKEINVKNIPIKLYDMIFYSNSLYDGCALMSYNSLINNGFLKKGYLFSATSIKDKIDSLDDLIIIPNYNKLISHHLDKIHSQLDMMGTEIYELRDSIEENLNHLNKGVDLHNYLKQH